MGKFLKNKKIKSTSILFHRSNPFDSKINCSTKIFSKVALDNNYKVFYLERIVNFLNFFKKKRSFGLKLVDGIAVLSLFSFVPFSKFNPLNKIFFYRYSYKSIRKKLISLLENKHPDIIWSTTPGSSALKEIFPNSILIMHVVDYYPAFLGKNIKQIEKNDYEKADVVFTIGQSLKNYVINELQIDKSKVKSIGQGVHFNLYTKNYTKPSEFSAIKDKIIIYVGLLSKLDKNLTSKLIDIISEKKYHIFFIGPNPENWLLDLSNEKKVKILKPIPNNQIPAYLTHSDIGIMLYDQTKKEIYNGQHPLKLYEYAAAGLQILSTKHDEYKFLKPPCYIIENSKCLEDFFHQKKNSRFRKKEIKKFAKKFSWNKIFRDNISRLN